MIDALLRGLESVFGWLPEDKDQFKRRFSLIAKFTRGAYGWSRVGCFADRSA